MSVPPRQLLVDRRAGVHVRVFEQRAGHGGSAAQGGAEEEDARSRCRGCGEHDCCSGDGAGRLGRCRAGFASPPFVAGNNRLLRAHFRALTRAFLRPFARYFGITAAAGRRDAGGSAWIYNAPATMLEPFAPAAFLAQLALELREQEGARPQQPSLQRGGAASSSSAAASPSAGAYTGAAAAANALAVLLECGAGAAGWLEIYSGFLKSPHFSPWFNGKRQAVTADIAETLRQLRAGVDGRVLMEGHDGALRAQERGALAERVRACIAQERARSDADERLLRKMEEHLALVSGRR